MPLPLPAQRGGESAAFPQPEASDSGDKCFGCRTVKFLPHTAGRIWSVSSSTTCDSFKANVAWEESCVLWLEAAGSKEFKFVPSFKTC